jgi:hypothetical protein
MTEISRSPPPGIMLAKFDKDQTLRQRVLDRLDATSNTLARPSNQIARIFSALAGSLPVRAFPVFSARCDRTCLCRRRLWCRWLRCWRSRRKTGRPLMALTMRKTGLASSIDEGRKDFTVYCGEWPMGRIYEQRGPGPYALVLVALRHGPIIFWTNIPLPRLGVIKTRSDRPFSAGDTGHWEAPP